MNTFKSLLWLTAIIFYTVSFMNCETTYVPLGNAEEIDYIQGTTSGTVILKIVDLHTNTPLADVLVTIACCDTAQSDSSGFVVFDSVKVGNYLVSCKKGGYEPVNTNLEITIDANSNTVPIVKQSTDVLYMPQIGVSLNGTVYYKSEDETQFADGATIECQLISNTVTFVEPIQTTVTQNGLYSFDDLPAYTTYRISVLPIIVGDITYKQSSPSTITSESAGDTLTVPAIILNPVPSDTFIALSHNLEELKTSDSVQINFSEPIDIALPIVDSIYLTDVSGVELLITKIWVANNTRLVIVPFNGEWVATETYRLYIKKIKSTTEKVFDNSDFNPYEFSPKLSGELGNVQNFRYRVGDSDTNKVDYNTTSINLIWSPLLNAERYEMYRKTESDFYWSILGVATDTIVATATTGLFADGMNVQYLVLAKNSTSISPLETAGILTVKDEKGPIISAIATATGFNNTLNILPVTVTVNVTAYIPEPMDTTSKPKVKIIEASYFDIVWFGDSTYKVNTEDCAWSWTTTTTGKLDVVVEPIANGAYDTLTIDFKGLTDVAGNPVDTTNGRGILKYQTLN